MSGHPYMFVLSLISIHPYLCLFPAVSSSSPPYVKSLVKRAYLSEGSAGTAKAYKAEVASLTSERADLRALVQHLSEDVVMHRSDLKHTLTAKSRAEE